MADKTALNTGYGHYADIVFAAGFAEAAGNFKELVTDTLIGVLTGGTRGSDGTYGEIVTLTNAAGDSINFGDNTAWDGLANFTVAVLVKSSITDVTDANPRIVLYKAGTGADSYQWTWLTSENTDASGGVNAANAVDTITDGLHPSLGTPADQWNLVGMTYDGSNVYCRINTVKGSGAATTGTGNATDHDLYIGSGFASRTWDGDFAMAVIMDVALNDTDWNALASDPLQVFASETASLTVTVPTGPVR